MHRTRLLPTCLWTYCSIGAQVGRPGGRLARSLILVVAHSGAGGTCTEATHTGVQANGLENPRDENILMTPSETMRCRTVRRLEPDRRAQPTLLENVRGPSWNDETGIGPKSFQPHHQPCQPRLLLQNDTVPDKPTQQAPVTDCGQDDVPLNDAPSAWVLNHAESTSECELINTCKKIQLTDATVLGSLDDHLLAKIFGKRQD